MHAKTVQPKKHHRLLVIADTHHEHTSLSEPPQDFYNAIIHKTRPSSCRLIAVTTQSKTLHEITHPLRMKNQYLTPALQNARSDQVPPASHTIVSKQQNRMKAPRACMTPELLCVANTISLAQAFEHIREYRCRCFRTSSCRPRPNKAYRLQNTNRSPSVLAPAHHIFLRIR